MTPSPDTTSVILSTKLSTEFVGNPITSPPLVGPLPGTASTSPDYFVLNNHSVADKDSPDEQVHRIQIAIPVPLRQGFEYLSPEPVAPGSRVLVPFGKQSNRSVVGVVLSRSGPGKNIKLKTIERVLDDTPVFTDSLTRLLHWATVYYHHPVGEVFQTAIPVRLRSAVGIENPVLEICYRRVKDLNISGTDQLLARAPKQQQLFRLLSDSSEYSLAELTDAMAAKTSAGIHRVLKILLKKGIIERRERHPPPREYPTIQFDSRLTDEQQVAVDSVVESLGQYRSFVLHGITGSGKTEVYLHIAQQCLETGHQVMVLVPEIALTPQLLGRFRSRLGEGVTMIHSGLSSQERYISWWRAREGTATVILGTRSAIFTPMKRPGLIIIDEEHDHSYKQQDGFRYHARDLAIKRASMENIPILLGSATPSMESINNMKTGKHRPLTLSRRTGRARLPEIEWVDLQKHRQNDGLTARLLEAIRTEINNGRQVILYINRRGYAAVAGCPHCDWKAKCDRCDACLTFHKKTNTLRCHHCGRIARPMSRCPDCERLLFYLGAGTQRLEEALGQQFPDARIVRFDSDEITTRASLEHILSRINQGNMDIIIGTQLISKGHDFPRVTLVGIVAPDQGLYSTDFRAPEYLFQQLVQVAGRAGRDQLPGKVIIQTSYPENPYLQMALGHDYSGFHQLCSQQRKAAGFPPFGFMTLWRAESARPGAAIQFLQYVRQIGQNIRKNRDHRDVNIMDPISSPREKLAGRYRAQLLVKSNRRKPLHDLLSLWLSEIETSAQARKVRWSLDVDPMEMD